MWVAILIGFIVGGWLAAFLSLDYFGGGLIGAVAGAALVAYLRRGGAGQPQGTLAEDRLARLEAEVRRVRAEVALLRAEVSASTGAARQSAIAAPVDPPVGEPFDTPSEAGAARAPQTLEEEAPPTRAEALLRNMPDRAAGTPEPSPAMAARSGPAGAAASERAPAPWPPADSSMSRAGAEEPRGEDAIDRLLSQARGWLFGGNTVVRVGLLVLFFGFAFLARYAVEHALLPIELRLAAVAAGGIALLITGWRLRAKRTAYAMSMQGGGVAVLYLTVFAALRLYQLLPPSFAFALLLVMVLLAAVLAVVQNAPALAVIGTAGGFMAPILASTGQGDHVALFTYYTVLNLGVLGIAWKKAWRVLNLTGFAFTFSIALAWGARDYRPEHFASTEPFLIGFFLMYVAAAVLYAWRQAPELRHTVDGGLVFGTPVVAFGLQAALCQHIEYAMAWSALAVGGFYVLLARWLLSRHRDSLRLLVEAFLALGVAFLTLAIPLALDGRWTAAAWALEGAALLWVGARQSRKLAIAAGLALQLGAGIFFGTADGFRGLADYRSMPVANAQLVGALMIALAGFFAARIAAMHRAGWPRALETAGPLLLAWATLWWLGGTLAELDAWLPRADMPAALLATFAASGALAGWLARRIDWGGLHAVSLIVVPGMLLSLAGSAQVGASPAAGWGLVAWALAVAAHVSVLRLAEPLVLLQAVLRYAHVAGIWLLTGALAWMLGDAVDRRLAANSWHLAAGLLAPMAAVQAVLWAKARERWPVGRWADAYLAVAAGGLVGVLLVAAFLLNLGSDGLARPLPFVPLLNPLELALAAVLLTTLRWRQAVQGAAGEAGEESLLRQAKALAGGRGFIALLAGLAFLFGNGVLLRTLHHATGVGWNADALFASDTVQMALSLFWALLGLVLTFLASRRAQRVLWIAGATLLGLVVAKLFLVDMASTGTVARIVSFLGAGVLLVIVGYLSPLPPARERTS